MEIRKLGWDSHFFGFPIGYIFIDKEPSSNFSKILNSEVYTLIQINSKHFINIISETHSLSYSEVKTVFSKNLSEISDVDIEIIDFEEAPLEENLLYDLAYESGKYSRYKQDHNISETKFKELYQLWIKNSINKSFADKIYYIKENDKILGFVTFKIKQEEAQIGLIAVLPNSQGKGFGKNLLKKVENFCLENNVKTLHIPTQLENITACNFYTKLGYEISEKIIIKHFWKNK